MTPRNEKQQKMILWLNEISIKDVPLVGGKNASLGEMYTRLTKKGIIVPNGFAITANAYWHFLQTTGLATKIKQSVKGLDTSNVRQLAVVGKRVRHLILESKLPEDLEAEIISAYESLSRLTKKKNVAVAVRSSATAEDLPGASFAGQQETYLNVNGRAALLLAVKKCIASLFTDRAISYREIKGFDHLQVALSVTVQEMVRSDVGASGVMFTLDTESGFPGVVLINAAYGLGEYVVKGRVTPDQFFVFKAGLKKNKKAIISRILGSKEVKLRYGRKQGTTQTIVTKRERDRFAITDDEVLQLARWGLIIEDHYGCAQDIEWAKDGETGKLYIVQARPETVKAQDKHQVVESYELKKKGKELASGIAIGQKIGAGRVRVIADPKNLKDFKKGEVLVTRITDPDWEPIMRIAAAIITEQGGKTSHAAIVSRELGTPCIVGAAKARQIIKSGEEITASCAAGEVGYVYKGILPFEVKKTTIKNSQPTRTKIMMNVGDPDYAFSLSFLPHDGVGLAREEFIFSNFVRIHPLALLNYTTFKDKGAKKQIAQLTRGYKRKADYGVDKLAEGIGRIAAAFYPHEVIVRLSDFKTNEYASLLGGKEFEPKEENPMLGWRGASRYYSKEYKPGFKLECAAIKKVREEWGLDNVIVMVPFCRTPEEGEKVLATMAEFGLKRGERGLQVYVMCEIPSNVILADEFARIFDGFSIGSNDLTQLTLGVDRDSSLVSHIYSEKNKAVTDLIKRVIKIAHQYKRKVGICGQAPSDYPEFAEMLVREGIDSISLNPDTVVKTRDRVAYLEKTLGKKGKKNSPKFLGLLAATGLASALLISLAGCSNFLGPMAKVDVADWSPAAVREKITASVAEQMAAQTFTLKEDSFAHFSLEYPYGWQVEHWVGGVTIKNPLTGEYLSVFKQLVDHPVAVDQEQSVLVDGVAGKQFYSQVAEGQIAVIELDLPDMVLEINSNVKDWNTFLSSFKFATSTTGLPDKAVNHWDVRDKTLCVPMITYARVDNKSVCTAF